MTVNKILEVLAKSSLANKILTNVKNNSFPIGIDGVVETQKGHLFSLIKKLSGRQSIFVTYSDTQAKKIYDDLKFFLGNDVYYYPAKNFIHYFAKVKSNDIYKQRFKSLDALVKQKNIAIVLSVHSLFDRLTEPIYFKNSFLKKILLIKKKVLLLVFIIQQ